MNAANIRSRSRFTMPSYALSIFRHARMTSAWAAAGKRFAATGFTLLWENTQFVSTMLPNGKPGICPELGRLTFDTTVPMPSMALLRLISSSSDC